MTEMENTRKSGSSASGAECRRGGWLAGLADGRGWLYRSILRVSRWGVWYRQRHSPDPYTHTHAHIHDRGAGHKFVAFFIILN